MVGSLLLRGMIAGVIAGIIAFGFARFYGEPQIDHAIAFEELMSATEADASEPELVSRATQAGIGLFTGLVIYGAAVGGLLSLVFAFTYGRISSLSARGTAALLALGAFIAMVLVPDLKYAPNPPAVGSPDTIGARTQLFFIMLVVSLLTMAAAVTITRRLWTSQGAWNAALAGGLFFVAVIAAVQYAMPDINEVPEQFSALVLWRFRLASIGMHAILWTVLGILFGILAERTLADRSSSRYAPRPALR
ncbi:hypothetical protein FHS85_000320 [Rhodoligotrophos appendicifer]|uniref:CbtA family protein n=1 Tax=Rhodoligotrophos appendicifer TaxID=987056 RepID=UPI00118103BA|nr:CbtA family protein [Rhodoligotrophos appendicifer]